MGRELQKKKNKSGSARVRMQKPKATKKQLKNKVLANPIVAANWDHSQTLAQNYKRLGLARRLNAPTGGLERNPVGGIADDSTTTTSASGVTTSVPATDSLTIASTSSRKSAALIPRDVRIERDPVTGAILRILDGSEDADDNDAGENTAGAKASNWTPLDDPLAAYDSDASSAGPGAAPNQHHPHIPSATSVAALQNDAAAVANPTSIVPQLAAHARATAGKPRKRGVSAREEAWLASLVEKYGSDYRRMERDKALNVRQQTKADIERRVKRWRAERGGV